MTALTSGTQRAAISDPTFGHAPQKGSTTIFQGGIVMLNTSGFALPAAASVAGALCVGIAMPRDRDLDRYNNSAGSDGDIDVEYVEGVFGLKNDGGAPALATTQPGTIVYAVDDQTVSLSSSGGTRPVAGLLWGYDTSSKTGPVLVLISKQVAKLASLLAQALVGTAFTQTYSTAATTVPAATTHAITDSSGGAASTTALAATNQGTLVGVDGTGSNAAPLAGVNTALAAIGGNVATLAAEAELAKADLLAVKKVLNAVIDLLQSAGIAS